MTSEPTMPKLCLSQEPEADAVLSRNPFALLVGLVLHQQIPPERAMAGPATITERIGRELDPALIAEYDAEQLAAVLSHPPAVHRAPIAMAARIKELAAHVAATYDGDVTSMWSDHSTGAEVVRRFEDLPGFGKPKARILLALLGKQLGVTPIGWREASAPYGEDGSYLSLADVVDQASLDKVRSARRERKQAKKASADEVSPTAPAGVNRRDPGTKVAARAATSPVDDADSASHVVAGTGVTGVRLPRTGP